MKEVDSPDTRRVCPVQMVLDNRRNGWMFASANRTFGI
jgi:hypothetical protein